MPEPTGTGAEERRWTIWVCPKCGRRMGGAYFCYAHDLGARCKPVEVVPAADLAALQERPEENQLTPGEARAILKLDRGGAAPTMLSEPEFRAAESARAKLTRLSQSVEGR